MSRTSRRVLPGFRLGLGYTIFYLSIIVLVPLAAGIFKAADLTFAEFWAVVWTPRAIAAYKLTFTASLTAAVINVVLGLIVAWSLVRYEFYGKRIVDALVDVPFALPTAVAGLVYASLYVKDGWLGQYLVPLGFEGAYTRTGIILVLVFTGFPFVVRTVQPVLEEMDAETEEAAAVLGANRWQTFRRVIMPKLSRRVSAPADLKRLGGFFHKEKFSDAEIASKGLTKYVNRGDGTYEKAAGSGPSIIDRDKLPG